MEAKPISLKQFFLFIIAGTVSLVFVFLLSLIDPRTTVVFCDVGQGDATYIRIKNKVDVLIDAGPNKKALQCLKRYMPFYDRTIEIGFLTHPQKDHYGGFLDVLNHFDIGLFIASPIPSENLTYKQLDDQLVRKHIRRTTLYSNEELVIEDAVFSMLWPDKEFLSRAIKHPTDPNLLSQVMLFEEKDYRILFTGDATDEILDRPSLQSIPRVHILKIPHHGSKNGLTRGFFFLADPEVSVISLGKKNAYGHPSRKVMDLLKASNTKIKRTDIDGDIIFKF